MTDSLVDVLLTPLLREGSADVVFDTLSYSAGPLPEQLLQSWPLRIYKGGSPDAANNMGEAGVTNNGFYGVEICYGEEDPWTPPERVKALRRCECPPPGKESRTTQLKPSRSHDEKLEELTSPAMNESMNK